MDKFNIKIINNFNINNILQNIDTFVSILAGISVILGVYFSWRTLKHIEENTYEETVGRFTFINTRAMGNVYIGLKNTGNSALFLIEIEWKKGEIKRKDVFEHLKDAEDALFTKSQKSYFQPGQKVIYTLPTTSPYITKCYDKHLKHELLLTFRDYKGKIIRTEIIFSLDTEGNEIGTTMVNGKPNELNDIIRTLKEINIEN